MSYESIIIRGARAHNLQNINLDLPRNKLIVITGLSGSGKSSLAFDTIYAEGQRRYVESLSAYARQFLGQMEKPDIDYIEGLSPAISIEQKTTSRNPRSTVGTITEIYDYLRLLFARCGIPHCPECGRELTKQSIDQILETVLGYPERTKIQILAPIVRSRKGEYRKELGNLQKEGFVRVRVDGTIHQLEEEIKLDKNKKHSIDVVVDRIVIKDGIRDRLADSIETALRMADGLVTLLIQIPNEQPTETMFSENLSCPDHNISLEDVHPRMFSFNSPHGACPTCHGLGEHMEFDERLIIPDRSLSINQGGIATIRTKIGDTSWYSSILKALAKEYKFSLDMPIQDLPEEIVQLLMYGSGRKELVVSYKDKRGRYSGEFRHRYEGIIPQIKRRYRETSSEEARKHYEAFMKTVNCPSCQGKRLRPESLAVVIDSLSISDTTDFSIRAALDFFSQLHFSDNRAEISERILKEIVARLNFLNSVGLSYISLDRKAETLSGGEAQRIRLATQIGSQLVGVLYVLDEPTIGLHQRDNSKLIQTLEHLRDLGNTVIVVEHDQQTIEAADYIVDLGPGAGIHGGEIVTQGTPSQIKKSKASLTGKYLSGKKHIPLPPQRHLGRGISIKLQGATKNNLKNINVEFPLGKFICVTGVSGSGKSTLVNELLFRGLHQEVYKSKIFVDGFQSIHGSEHIDKIINIDQSPIGRTPRSNPATYTGVFTPIRELFASLPESKIRGYKPGRFSFNVKGGRCESCEGDGQLKIEMHFLPDIYVTCDVCKGKRYNQETLTVKYKEKTISDVLDMSVEEAHDFFSSIPSIKNKLQTLEEVGLGYIKLGQSAVTLSGGEAQRIKLASELSKRSTGKTFYILDEPTTGLHFDDVAKLVEVLVRFVDLGNTVIVIEHNLDVIKIADHIIDLGPEGGDEGGTVVFTGSPEDIINHPKSYTGKYLREVMD